jgi:hypothetical protein
MSQSFADWIAARKKVITLPSGIEAEIRLPSGFKTATMGPLPGIEGMEGGDGKSIERTVEISRRYVVACLSRLGDQKDPIGSGVLDPDDLPMRDVDAIIEAVISLMPRPEKEGVREDGVPLAGTDSRGESPESSTESPADTESVPQS